MFGWNGVTTVKYQSAINVRFDVVMLFAIYISIHRMSAQKQKSQKKKLSLLTLYLPSNNTIKNGNVFNSSCIVNILLCILPMCLVKHFFFLIEL